MADFIVVIVILAIVAAAIVYIIKEKKRGTKCIGCPVEGSCPHKAAGNAGCSSSCHTDEK